LFLGYALGAVQNFCANRNFQEVIQDVGETAYSRSIPSFQGQLAANGQSRARQTGIRQTHYQYWQHWQRSLREKTRQLIHSVSNIEKPGLEPGFFVGAIFRVMVGGTMIGIG
jgi:hypothetical protein